jgi:hypothetical protein
VRSRGWPLLALAALATIAGCGGRSNPVVPGASPPPLLGCEANPTDASASDPDSNRVTLELLKTTGVDLTQSGDL